jgi:acetyltransferase-like isoleucine patch superfamily enzyme
MSVLNSHISPLAKIGQGVKIGKLCLIHDNVEIGDNTIVSDFCTLGEPLHSSYKNQDYVNPLLTIGQNSLIRSHAVIYAGSKIGNNFQTGHRVTIRENMIIGHNVSVGTLCDLQGFGEIGNYARLHSNIFICQGSILEDYVFVYPGVTLTDDHTPPSSHLRPPTIGRYSQIGAKATILPGSKIGCHALIAAGSLVTRNIPDFMMVSGNPAKIIKDAREIKNRETGERHYPWPYNFSRGMPWQDIGFKEYCVKNNLNEFGLKA